ncbi:hypothetical protein FEDK69T_30060 [Flavobacterium enshiense DK69]|nr:hypothetical protein FEDK69T_30060 [Flavobacterium enshiense DK69]
MELGGKHIDFIIGLSIFIIKFGLLSFVLNIFYFVLFKKIKIIFSTSIKSHLILFGSLLVFINCLQSFGIIIHGFTPPELIKQIIWSSIIILILIFQLRLHSHLFKTKFLILPNGKFLLIFNQLYYSIIFIIIFIKLFPLKML